MGMFLNFECDTCGRDECDCPLEKRSIYRVPTHRQLYEPSEAYKDLRQGDIICSAVENGKPVDEAFILDFNDKGYPIVRFNNDFRNEEWKGNYLKICSTLSI